MPPRIPLTLGPEKLQNLWRVAKGIGRRRVLKDNAATIEKRPVTWPYVKRFLAELRPMRGHVLAILVLMPLAAMGGTLMPMAIKVLFDGVIPLARGQMETLAGGSSRLPEMLVRYFAPGDLTIILAFVVVLLVLGLLVLTVNFMMRYLMMTAGERLVSRMRHRLHEQIQFLSIRYIEDTQVGGIISRVMGDVEAVRHLIFGGFLNFSVNVVCMAAYMAALFWLDWYMALATVVLVPGYAVVFLRLRKRLRPAWRHIREEVARLTARVAEVFGGARVVKAFSKERYENSIFFRWVNDLMRKNMRVHRLHMGMHSGAEGVIWFSRALVLGLGAWRVIDGRISLGDFTVFNGMLWMFFEPMVGAVQINNQLQQAMASVERIYDVLDRRPEVEERPGARPVGRLSGDVAFENVSFRYNRDEPRRTLDGVDFHARPGECLAVVGPSGAGKTTIMSLLCRFYDVEQGRILIDGRDVRDLEISSYRRNLAIVLQDTWLFNGTVRENIAYARPKASREEVRHAAEQANALGFIEKLSKGFEEPVGERGVKLSGGQKQRIAIARAILADPRILILDEATSSLDSRAESQIQEALERLMRGRTTLVVAHRLSTITNADRILVIDDGRIVEEGTHDRLLAARGAYYHMFLEQYGKVRFLRRAAEQFAAAHAQPARAH